MLFRSDFQNVSFDWSVDKFHCQINVVGRYVLISKMNVFKIFSRVVVFKEVMGEFETVMQTRDEVDIRKI